MGMADESKEKAARLKEQAKRKAGGAARGEESKRATQREESDRETRKAQQEAEDKFRQNYEL
ncbi:hypothetical protein [Streptomyces purpureus]|uniref:Uncharacterized protein n=1 Tax=Streptomyces purpureus TaxID=1951 RepID=A0A918LPN7_9ACTN|nr:hypothetical protein [Streptomyces purpureus]GGT34408.1 hypothetical protein GCM10014713_30010 [Streptomyces purpureus]